MQCLISISKHIDLMKLQQVTLGWVRQNYYKTSFNLFSPSQLCQLQIILYLWCLVILLIVIITWVIQNFCYHRFKFNDITFFCHFCKEIFLIGKQKSPQVGTQNFNITKLN